MTDTFKTSHFNHRRRESTFVGGDCILGRYFPKQPVTINRCADEDEDQWLVTMVDGKTAVIDGCELSPHPDAVLTNEEFVALMMNRSQTVLVQPFILIAIEEYAKKIAAADAADLETGLMSGQAWKNTALEVLGWFAARSYADKERRGELAPAG